MVKLLIFETFIFINSIYITISFNPDKQKKPHQQQLEIGKTKDIRSKLSYKKNCQIKEQCKECTFEELKSLQECQSTGFKLLKYCTFLDENKNIENTYYSEPCFDGKISSIYIFLICSIIITICSVILRKSRKQFLVTQILDKLTIFKKNVYN